MKKADYVAHLTTSELEERLHISWSKQGVRVTTSFNGIEHSILSKNYDAYQRILRCDLWDVQHVELGYTYRGALLSLYIEAYLDFHWMKFNERQWNGDE